MRRLFPLLVLWIGLIGAGAPAFACATAAAAGDCCPPGSPTGCAQPYEQLGAEAIVCCATADTPSAMVAADAGRELQIAQGDHESADPAAAVASILSVLDLRDSKLALPVTDSVLADASLTYLTTARLRL